MLNIQLLKKLQPYLDMRAREEKEEELILALLNNEEFTLDTIEQEYKPSFDIPNKARTLKHWADMGLISHVGKGKRRKFNRVETVWFEIIVSLRKFGLSIESIQKVKEQLETIEDGDPIHILHFAFLYSIVSEPYILMVYPDGTINLLPESKYVSNFGSKDGSTPPHLYINLLSIGENIFPNNNFKTIGNSSKTAELSDKELQLLYYLRTGDFESMEVTLKDGDIRLIKGTKPIKNTKLDSIKAINNCEFQDIEIKMTNGKTVSMKVTEFIKV